MQSVVQAALASWSFPPVVTALNLLTALLYIRGWIELRRVMPGRFTPGRLACFLSGIAALEIALASPIDTFDPFLLTDHMLQHMFLMVIVPPLVLLGDPLIPLLRGLPRWVARNVLSPFLSWPALARLGTLLIDPPVALLLLSVAMVGWHIPAAYELALRSPGWHEIEHACFLVASLLFWWPVIQPWPSRPQWPRVGDARLFAARRLRQQRGFRIPRFFRARALSVVSHRPASRRVFGAKRSGGRGRRHVGDRVVRVPDSRRDYHGEAALAAAAGRGTSPHACSGKLTSAPLGASGADAGAPARRHRLRMARAGYGRSRWRCGSLAGRIRSVPGHCFRRAGIARRRRQRISPCSSRIGIQARWSSMRMSISPFNRPAARRSVVRATHEQSTNKLLEAATVDLPTAGSSDLRVSVRRGSDEGTVATTLDITSPAAESSFSWGYLVALAIGAGLLILHRVLRSKPLRRGASLPHAP